jgi:hypothetical protein
MQGNNQIKGTKPLSYKRVWKASFISPEVANTILHYSTVGLINILSHDSNATLPTREKIAKLTKECEVY